MTTSMAGYGSPISVSTGYPETHGCFDRHSTIDNRTAGQDHCSELVGHKTGSGIDISVDERGGISRNEERYKTHERFFFPDGDLFILVSTYLLS